MMKVAVRLDSLVRDGAVPSESKAARIAATASIAGVDSLVAVLPESNPTSWLKPLSIAKTVFDGPFAVACTASQENLDLISKLHPDLVISSAPGLNTVNGDDLDGASIQSFIESLRTRQIPCGVCVSASIGDIKRTRQLDADLVVLPAAPVVNASDTSATVPAIEELEAGAIAANRLGMRVLIAGELDRTSWAAFSDLGLIEGVVLGDPFVERAVSLGLSAAVGELRTQS